jgi:hypothetical protein
LGEPKQESDNELTVLVSPLALEEVGELGSHPNLQSRQLMKVKLVFRDVLLQHF